MYANVKEIFEAAARISDELERAGNATAAAEIRDTLNAYWTTSTEALGELRTSLEKVEKLSTSPNTAEFSEQITDLRAACTDLMGLV